MPAMNGMSFGGGSGASDGFQAEDGGEQPPWYVRFGNWFVSLFPQGTPPEHGQATPQNELPDLLAIEEEASQLRTNAQLAGNIDPTNTMRAQLTVDDHGTPMSENRAMVAGLILVRFPLYAGEKLLDVALTYFFGPQELAVLELTALARGLIVRQVKNKLGKWVLKFWKTGTKEALEEAAEAEVKALAKQIEKQLLNPKGFKTFDALKRYLGPAGDGRVWHHIVEQRAGNIARFGEEAIHNTTNVMNITREANQILANYYASKKSFTRGLIVRDWLAKQSFAKQREFGLDILRRVLSGEILPE
jgi:hypothetical protein